MSTVETIKSENEKGGIPIWDETKKFFVTRNWFRFLVALTLILWGALIGWVLAFAPITKAEVRALDVGANLAMVLAPVLAAAATVERTLETTFNVMEGSWRTMVAYLGRGLRWLKNAETEVMQARQFLAEASDKYNQEMQAVEFGGLSASAMADAMQARIATANRLMNIAQTRLKAAEESLAAAPSSESYISAKSAASIMVGLMLGVVIAAIGQLQMFAMLGIGIVPARIDVLITGLIIGSGAYPVHSLVGILQQGKDTLDSVKGYFNRAAPSVVRSVESLVPASESPTSQPALVTTTVKSEEEKPSN